MNFTTIVAILDNKLNRETTNTKKYGNTVSWTKPTTFTTTYNDGENNTITNCQRICLQNTTQGIKLTINHHNRHKLTKTNLTDITSFSIT